MSTEPNGGHIASQGDVDSLRSHVDAKFDGLISWVERLSTAVERIADQRERLAVLETLVKSQSDHITNLWTSDAKRAQAISDLRNDVTSVAVKVAIYCGAFSAVGMLIISLVVKQFGLG